MITSEVRQSLFDEVKTLENPRDILKSKRLKSLYVLIKKAAPEERAILGNQVNQLKKELIKKVEELEIAKLDQSVEPIDVTAPFDYSTANNRAKKPSFLTADKGTIHPLNIELKRVIDIFSLMGFTCQEARQIDDDYHMFTSLNFPPNHPARDGYDTFRTEEGFIPPAHTTAMDNRILRQGKEVLDQGGHIAVVNYGRVFRNEDADVTHDHTFNQIEGVFVSKDANMAQMLGVLTNFFETYYNQKLHIKTQPSYFPFTEPSLEFAIEKPASLGGKGKGSEWLEMLGCGMLHPNVLKEAGIDPNKYRGFAWGGGLERLVMLRYGVEDLRLFNSGKLNFLKEFK